LHERGPENGKEPDFDSNEWNDSDWHFDKQNGPGIAALRGIRIGWRTCSRFSTAKAAMLSRSTARRARSHHFLD
jgi:hypothetical protein